MQRFSLPRLYMRPLRQLASLACAGLLIAACSSGGSEGGGTATASPITGTFVDSPVNGLHYTALPSNPAGSMTANGGQYQCVTGDAVTFDLGGRVIGNPQPCGELVTVLSVFGATSITDLRVKNLAQLLLTLSGIPADSQPIELPSSIPASLPTRLDFSDPKFEQMLQTTLPDRTLVTQEQVIAHLRTSFTTLTVVSNGGQITSSPTGLICTTGICSQDFVAGTRVTLAAVGAGFTGWSGTAGCAGIGTCQVLLSSMQAIRAIFAPPPPALTITTSSPLPAGSVGQLYSFALNAAGGTAPYTRSIISGALPAGLTLNGITGQISGKPKVQGTSTFTVRMQDSGNPKQTVTQQFSLTINLAGTFIYGGTLMLTNAPAASGGTFVAGSAATGFRPDVANAIVGWTEESGTVFETMGLEFGQANNVVSLSYTVSDFASPAQFITISCTACSGVVVNPTTGTLTLTNAVLTADFPTPISVTFNGSLTFPPVIVTSDIYGSGIVGQPYSFTLSAIGGTPPYTWTRDPSSAGLPGGLSLSSNGVLSGTPTSAGYFGQRTTGSILLKVTDGKGHSSLYDENILIHPAGTTSVPNSRVYIGQVPITGNAFYDSQSRLIGIDGNIFVGSNFIGGKHVVGRGTLVPTDVFFTSDQIVRMGRWAGPGLGDGDLSLNNPFSVNHQTSYHVVSGIPSVFGSLTPRVGQTIYSVIASTRPTVRDGSTAPGTGVTGTVTVDWGAITVSFDLIMNGPGGSVPIQSGPLGGNFWDGLVLFGSNPTGATPAPFGNIPANAVGSFYGTEAIPQYVGLKLLIYGDLVVFPSSNDVEAAVVLQKQQ